MDREEADGSRPIPAEVSEHGQGSVGGRGSAGLPGARVIAFDALQLLKHALGLATSEQRPFSLLYLYYDQEPASDVADRHRDEVACFADRVDGKLGFRGMSYQTLFGVLAAGGGADAEYVGYLKERYY